MPSRVVLIKASAARAVAPVASQQAFTSGHNPYPTCYGLTFAFCHFLCPLHNYLCLHSGCLPIGAQAVYWVFLVSQGTQLVANQQMGLGTHYPPSVSLRTNLRA